MSKIGYSPSLPLNYNKDSGPYNMLNTLDGIIKQNLKMLLLTAPGERIMMPDYGVGLRNYLFMENTIVVKEDIESRILQQVNIFMPFLNNINVDIKDFDSTDGNAISVRVSFFIGPLGKEGYVELVLSPNIISSGEIKTVLDQTN
jgi:phage baseplate assembly protein W